MEVFKKTGSEIGKKAAEKSGGLFSADDWHCSRYAYSLHPPLLGDCSRTESI